MLGMAKREKMDLNDSIQNLLTLSFELTAPKRKKSQAGGI